MGQGLDLREHKHKMALPFQTHHMEYASDGGYPGPIIHEIDGHRYN